MTAIVVIRCHLLIVNPDLITTVVIKSNQIPRVIIVELHQLILFNDVVKCL